MEFPSRILQYFYALDMLLLLVRNIGRSNFDRCQFECGSGLNPPDEFGHQRPCLFSKDDQSRSGKKMPSALLTPYACLQVEIGGQHNHVANGNPAWPCQHEHQHIGYLACFDQAA